MTSPSQFGALEQRALLSVATQFFVNGAVFASFVPRLPEIRDVVDITVGELGLLITIGGMIGLLGSLGASPIIERLGTRRTLIIGALALVGFLPVLGLARTPYVLVIGFAGLQTFDVIVDVAMNLQGSWLSARRHAPVMNRLHGLWSLGTVVGGLAASQLAGLGVSLRDHFFGVSALMFVVIVFVGRGLLREDREFSHVAVTSHAEHRPEKVRGRGKRTALAALAIAGGCAIVVELTSSDWAAFRLSDDFGAGAGFAGLAYVAFTSGMTLGRFGGDSVLVKIGSDQLFRGALVLSFAGMAAASLVPNRAVTIAAYMVAGVGISTFFPKLYDDAARYPGKSGAGLGALTGGSRLAGFIAPAVVGALAATELSVGQASALVTLPTLGGLAVVSFTARRLS
ncbi:MAG: MFS transporter [Acidimicrobiales bacterium]|nr:MFS transporter [Acidimicrobiales bacterium]